MAADRSITDWFRDGKTGVLRHRGSREGRRTGHSGKKVVDSGHEAAIEANGEFHANQRQSGRTRGSLFAGDTLDRHKENPCRPTSAPTLSSS